MKIRLYAEIIDDNGNKVIKPVEVETEIPDIKEFGKKEEFYQIFDRYERPVLEARNQLGREITKEYLNQAAETAKKRAKKRKSAESNQKSEE